MRRVAGPAGILRVHQVETRRPRVGLHAKQTAPILNLARDVGRPIGSLPGISQGRFEAAIFREVEGLALE